MRLAILLMVAACAWAQPIPSGGGGGNGVAPVTATFNTGSSTCSAAGGGTTPTCTASPTAGTGSAAGAVIVHNLGTSNPWLTCYDGSGNMLGSSTASTSVTAVVASSANQLTATFSGATTGKCVVSTGSQGPTGATGATGPQGAAGAGSGTVTQIVFAAPLTGGTVTNTGTVGAGALPTRSGCFDFGADNAASDLVDADIGPQGRIFMIPVIGTITEITVAANAGTPNVIVQKNHAGSATDLISATLATGAAGIVACAATTSACLDGTVKSGSVSIVTAGSANVLAAGDWIQTKTGSGFASTGAKRLSVCVTYAVN